VLFWEIPINCHLSPCFIKIINYACWGENTEKKYIYIYIYIYLFIYGSYRRDSDGKMYVRYEVIGVSSVAVPTHFFKVIVAETADQKYDMEAYVMPNQVIDDSTPLTVFQVCGTQLWLRKLSDCDTSYVNVYVRDHYFIWQLSVATSCWILYCINIAHSATAHKQDWVVARVMNSSCQIKWWPCTQSIPV